MAALHRDGFLVDDVPVEPGDEAVLRDGAVLRVGEAKMVLRVYQHRSAHAIFDGPYVTSARRGKAQQGKGDGIGAPGRAEARREKKLQKKLQKKKEKTHKRERTEEKKGAQRP